MSITATKILSDGTAGTNLTTFGSAALSSTPAAGKIYHVAVSVFGGSVGTTGAPTLTGAGVTWTAIAAQSALTPIARGYTFTFVGAGPGSAGGLTYTPAAGDNFNTLNITVTEISGASDFTNIVQGGIDGAGAGPPSTQTLAIAPAAGNAIIAQFAQWDSAPVATPRASWTEVDEIDQPGNGLSHEVQFYAGSDTAASVTWDNNGPMGGIAIEIIAVASQTAALTGTAVNALTEYSVKNDNKVVIITMTGDTLVAAGATFNAQRQAIINGLTSAQSETKGWNAVVKALQGVAGVVRTDNVTVTITLDAQPTYSITAQETITVTMPAAALVGGVPVVATPTFSVQPDAAQAQFVKALAKKSPNV